MFKAKEVWKDRQQLDKQSMFEIAKENNVPLEIAAILQKRGIKIGETQSFLNPMMMAEYNPYLLKDIENGCRLVQQEILKIQKENAVKTVNLDVDDIDCDIDETETGICIVNDYDVDGATSGVIMKEGIEACGGTAFIISPDRIIDGYGISKRIIDEAIKRGARLIITTDNGIAATEQIQYARDKGLTVVVTDHHEVPFTEENGEKTYIIPNANAVINPKQADCKYPFKEICGAVVAYKFVEVLLDLFMIKGSQKAILMDKWCELAALATVCDVMPLIDENRHIVAKGLEIMRRGSSYIGIRQLLKEQKIEPTKISSYHFGFVIGPCINATGRMTGSVDTALALLLEKDHVKAKELAKKLIELNDERKLESAKDEEKAINIVENSEPSKIYVIHIPNSNPAIMGIVAGRVKEYTGHPCLCLTETGEKTEDGDEILKGSGRSVTGYNMFEMISKRKDMCIAFGGHELAAGITLKKSILNDFTKLINDDFVCDDSVFVKTTLIDLFMDIGKINENVVNSLTMLEPFGNGNPKVTFATLDSTIVRASRVGSEKKYLRLSVLDKNTNKMQDAMYFGDANYFDSYIDEKYGEGAKERLYRGCTNNEMHMDLSYSPRINTWNGTTSVEYTINSYK